MCFLLNLAHAVPALSNANAAPAKAVAVVMASLAMAVLAYVACVVPVSAIEVSVFVAKAVCAGQPRLMAARAARDEGQKGTRQPVSTQ